ncbi:hypothetical protein HHX38_14185 [Streptomyces sp. PKU-MA01144]|uniref:hypothetical protein n=1 Tax=Streptomyces sp. PKU-MA01144 TaxID=2729138 RepID=UPI00147D4F3A|nr:hypothetical protein [Streptomyces sp. PKU-MA01144]NNJ05278.1 hypothetical protein [Streptomyces sp. PKU-MA01144]
MGIRSYDRSPASRAAHFEDSGGRGYYQRGRNGKLREVSTGEQVEFDQHGNHDD